MKEKFRFSTRVLGIITILAFSTLCGCTDHKTTDIESAPSVLAESSPVDTLADYIEKDALEKEMLELALTYREQYVKMDKGTASNVVISEECVKQIIEHIGSYGYTVTGLYQDMINYEPFEEFLFQALDGKEVNATYYSVNSNGGFSRSDFHSLDKKLFVTTASVDWDDEMNPFIGYSYMRTIDKWEYTNKGYLLYETKDSLWQYALQRIKPLGKKERDLWNAYIRPIGYQGNNLFLIDWDQSSMDQIAFNDLYENLYYIETGKWTDYDFPVVSIPAEEFEPLFTKYFDVTIDFLHENAVYYKDKNTYFWERLTCSRHDIWFPAAEPEVVHYWENEDGTITMVVDAVDDYRGKDRAFTHEVTVQVFEDGSFQYVSNRIRSEDKGNVPSYTPRSESLY